jgi:O-antigen ligase
VKPSRAEKTAAPVPRVSTAEKVFALLCGLWIGLSFLKFGNPIIFDQMVSAPKTWEEFVFTPWPIAWGYILLVGVITAAIRVLKVRVSKRDWPMGLFAFWLFWQLLSSARSVEPRLSNPTVVHFVSCGVALLIGWWAHAGLRASRWLWTPIVACFFYVLFAGFDQHAGGLEATRKAFYEQSNWQLYPKEYLLKIQSNRIFSTLVYPNAFAGLILMMLPAVLWQAWQLTDRWPRVLRGVLVGLFAYLGFACLYWTGSKGGWLIALILAAVLALQTNISRKLKTGLIAAGLVLGLVAFFVRFSAYFEKGATSVGARFVYWKAAAQIVRMHPILGSGPGTFSVLFKKLKPPEAEMAKLVHNDYLEQASDSGIPGGLGFASAVCSLLFVTKRNSTSRLDSLLWLGLLGWALQGFMEFGLYIPALAWPAFLFLGALYGGADRGKAF